MTSLDPSTVRLSRLRSELFDGPGAAGFDELAAALGRAAAAERDVAGDLDVLLRRDGAVHAGAAADGARAHLTAVCRDAGADAGLLDRTAGVASEIAGLHAAARRDVGPGPAALAPAGLSAAALLGATLDGAGDEGRARTAVAMYRDRCDAALRRLPAPGR